MTPAEILKETIGSIFFLTLLFMLMVGFAAVAPHQPSMHSEVVYHD